MHYITNGVFRTVGLFFKRLFLG